MGERLNGIQEVVGSIPIISTTVKGTTLVVPFLLYKENHSLGEWFKRRLLPIMRTRKTPFARIEVRSGNCTKKQREVTQNERQ